MAKKQGGSSGHVATGSSDDNGQMSVWFFLLVSSIVAAILCSVVQQNSSSEIKGHGDGENLHVPVNVRLTSGNNNEDGTNKVSHYNDDSAAKDPTFRVLDSNGDGVVSHVEFWTNYRKIGSVRDSFNYDQKLLLWMCAMTYGSRKHHHTIYYIYWRQSSRIFHCS